MNKEIFVQNIKRQCSLRGVKPTIACRDSGAGADMINQIERRGSVPSVERVQRLAQYLGVTVSELLGEAPPGTQVRAALSEHLAQEARERSDEENLTGDEQQLIKDYRSLNPQGQEYIRQTMHMTVQTYKKSPDLSKLESQG